MGKDWRLLGKPWLVISDKRPVEDCDRASQHSLHGARGHALGEGGPENSHGFGAAYIAIDDGGFDASGAIRLHPAVDSEGKTRQLLAEVFNHVVSLHKKINKS